MKQKRLQILLVIFAAIMGWILFDRHRGDDTTVQPVVRTAANSGSRPVIQSGASQPTAVVASGSILPLQARGAWPVEGGADLFASAPPTEVTSSVAVASEPAETQLPPLAVYLGQKIEGRKREAFFQKDSEVLSVQEHGKIDENYRLDKIGIGHLEVTYLPGKKRITVPIGGTE